MSIELGTVQTGTGKIVPARKFKCTQAARGMLWGLLLPPPPQPYPRKVVTMVPSSGNLILLVNKQG